MILPFNDSSLVTKVTFRNKSILFTGDATGNTTDAISGIQAKSHVFDSDHHGSDEKDSNNLPWVYKVAPQYAVFSVGKRYKHPDFPVVIRVCEGGLNGYNGINDDARAHPFSFFSSKALRDLAGMDPFQTIAGKARWYATSTTRQVFNTADVKDVWCEIEDSDSAPIIVRPHIVKPEGASPLLAPVAPAAAATGD